MLGWFFKKKTHRQRSEEHQVGVVYSVYCMYCSNCPRCETLWNDTEVLAEETDDDKRLILETFGIASVPNVINEGSLVFGTSTRSFSGLPSRFKIEASLPYMRLTFFSPSMLYLFFLYMFYMFNKRVLCLTLSRSPVPFLVSHCLLVSLTLIGNVYCAV